MIPHIMLTVILSAKSEREVLRKNKESTKEYKLPRARVSRLTVIPALNVNRNHPTVSTDTSSEADKSVESGELSE